MSYQLAERLFSLYFQTFNPTGHFLRVGKKKTYTNKKRAAVEDREYVGCDEQDRLVIVKSYQVTSHYVPSDVTYGDNQ